MPRPADLARRLHRIAAAVAGVYVLAHLANHLAALHSIGAHIAFMQAVRRVTRIPPIEVLLLAGVGVQAGSGLGLVLRLARGQGPRRPPFERLQAWSGAYLALFLLVHVVSVLFGRAVLGLDTNFRFAAAGLNIAPWPLFFGTTFS
jgi:succinate dehydrogenase/fumarate reductase cytochrome b subunit